MYMKRQHDRGGARLRGADSRDGLQAPRVNSGACPVNVSTASASETVFAASPSQASTADSHMD
jgi:hypothetical protein